MQVALDRNGVLTLESFRLDRAIDAIRDEGLEHQHLAYFALDSHNIYLKPDDSQLQPTHPRNRKVTSPKGQSTAAHLSMSKMCAMPTTAK